MRRRMCVIAAIMAFSLTGCLHTEIPDLSHVDNNIAAQYMADALLRKDKKYDESLDYDHSILQPTPAPTPAATPVPKDNSASVPEDGAGVSSKGDSTGQSTLSEVSLSDLYGIEGITVTPTSYELKKSYGSDQYSSVVPSAGKRLLIVHFKISNTSSQVKRVNFAKQQIRAQAVVNGTAVGSALPSIAAGDLQFLNKKLAAGSKMQGVLLFEIDKSQKVSDVSVEFSSGSNRASISVH